jgi:predicted nucleic acid-binding Zn ribbon protein
MRKIERLGGKAFLYRCQVCGYETDEITKTKKNADEMPLTVCPVCGSKVREL